ncbi:MAG: NAD-dependent epimerase/dehydratase family protein [Myxococcales bacterium]|nr:NAD-dependent epimerase/dehydratase family protein [Myxococcales bacterium]
MRPTHAPTNLVTGATGLIGHSIVTALRVRGRPVRALVRDVARARALLPDDVELVRGDVTDRASLDDAARGCEFIYHAAGLPEQWLPDPHTFHRVNVDGTRNIIDAARAHAVGSLIYTSTIDVFEGMSGQRYDESRIDPLPKGTHYERSKQVADRLVIDATGTGPASLRTALLHPAGAYGPGPAGSRGLNDFFQDLRDGKIPMLLPGGMPVVYAPDVGEGHVLAADAARPGDRFILSGGYHTLSELAEETLRALAELRHTPRRRAAPPVMPMPIVRLVSRAGEALSRLSKRPPLIPAGQLHFLMWGARPDASRARDRLGWTPTPLAEGLRATLRYLARHAGDPARDGGVA